MSWLGRPTVVVFRILEEAKGTIGQEDIIVMDTGGKCVENTWLRDDDIFEVTAPSQEFFYALFKRSLTFRSR